MSLLRVIRPVARRTAVLTSSATNRAPCARRFLNTETAPTLYTAHASVTGARNGHIESEGFTADLAQPTSLGGKGGKKTNPEELFAAGYGACFQSAMGFGAKRVGMTLPRKPEDCVVETDVSLVGDMKAADFWIKVHMKIKVKGLSKEEIEKVIAQTEEICPYSRATKGNVATTFEAVAL